MKYTLAAIAALSLCASAHAQSYGPSSYRNVSAGTTTHSDSGAFASSSGNGAASASTRGQQNAELGQWRQGGTGSYVMFTAVPVDNYQAMTGPQPAVEGGARTDGFARVHGTAESDVRSQGSASAGAGTSGGSLAVIDTSAGFDHMGISGDVDGYAIARTTTDVGGRTTGSGWSQQGNATTTATNFDAEVVAARMLSYQYLNSSDSHVNTGSVSNTTSWGLNYGSAVGGQVSTNDGAASGNASASTTNF